MTALIVFAFLAVPVAVLAWSLAVAAARADRAQLAAAVRYRRQRAGKETRRAA